jgi:hypothetical protein
MEHRQIPERHTRSERMAGLIADTVLGVGGDVADSVQTGDRVSALVDDLSMDVGKQAA